MIELALPTQESSFAVPIRMSYKQIADDLAERIGKGEYADGEKLPSYRELAALYSVSPKTAQAAYRELKTTGVVVSASGQGHFVRQTNK